MPNSRSQKTMAAESFGCERPLTARGPPGALSSSQENFPVVGIGASAGGLDACRKLLHAMPASTGMSFILVQHLDPTHESMLADLLASHTHLTVQQAAEGMLLEVEHLYVIPPGTYLAVGAGRLHLSPPQAHHGARLPFDFLLHSLAEDCHARAVCVVLSGTGTDGSLGLKSVKKNLGLVIAQAPDEAGFDGMPRSAILTGAVDLVLPVAGIPDAIVEHYQRKSESPETRGVLPEAKNLERLPDIIELLRTRTSHDFTFYKEGTIQRRIERRMALAAIPAGSAGQYLEILKSDAQELELLAKDLLINVTSFFRDPKVFAYLAEHIIPGLVRTHSPDHPLRIWTAGCSTGEETYSIAILFREAMAAAKCNIKLQIFASDVDPDAIVRAREGVYPETIEEDVSPARLASFFSKEDHGYRVLPELRQSVVFTVQDVLADPPFSRLDFVSCRNLLIYLGPEAQAKAISLFHFALRQGGILLLGGSETAGNVDGRFEVVSKAERVFRHIGRSKTGDFGFLIGPGDGLRSYARGAQGQRPSRQEALAGLCRRLVIEAYAPAAVLIDCKHQCLFSLGATDRYLRVSPGHPTHDLLAMAPQGLRTKLRSAIQRAMQEKARVAVAGGRLDGDASGTSFRIEVTPIPNEAEQLLLVCFVDEPKQGQKPVSQTAPGNAVRVTELELELEATRTELQGAIHSLEVSSEEQKAINEEASSVNEEFQSTNEELLTSKEELQSLNEELTALNSQLTETLDGQRTASNDLQNILYSTDVATLFLDMGLKIRFYTPATKSLFNVIPGDIGRPLADLHSLSADTALPADARAVLQNHAPLEREIETESGVWFIRRILPYRNHANRVEGVVITFTDVSERKRIRKALEDAKHQSELANAAKSRFLAAASHDLRQPLQSLTLLQGLLAKTVQGEKAERLVARIDDTLGAMSGMLNTLLDINQIDSGTVHADMVDFAIGDMFARLRNEFNYHAQAKRLQLRVVPCGLTIFSDPRLLEQMIRNLLSNALKYTKCGKILLGCRRRDGIVNIEIWDTGVGIAEVELHAIFDEYHQIDNAARERSRGLGLGLSIVQRLGKLLGHRVSVRSQPGKGSVFSIEVKLPQSGRERSQKPAGHDDEKQESHKRSGTVLVVEDDPEVRELLELFLKGEGHVTATAPDGLVALGMVAHDKLKPDLILADFNLPKGLNGLELAAKLREALQHQVPVIILTGDISTGTLRDIASQDCAQLNKPVKLRDLTHVIQRLLPLPPRGGQARAHKAAGPADGRRPPVIFVVDDDGNVRDGIRGVLEDAGQAVEDYSNCEAFLEAYRPGREACLLIDAYLPGMNGLELLKKLHDAGHRLPAIMITGNSDVPIAIQAMKAGACDFIEKPIGRDELLASVARALEQSRDENKLVAWQESAANQIADLTPRQLQIMDMVLAGHPSKNIAADLGISQRTVENHRASIMSKTGAKSLPALARLALAATRSVADGTATQGGQSHLNQR